MGSWRAENPMDAQYRKSHVYKYHGILFLGAWIGPTKLVAAVTVKRIDFVASVLSVLRMSSLGADRTSRGVTNEEDY